MPQIPTDESRVTILGSPQPRANPADFGALSASATADLGDSMNRAAATAAQIAEQKIRLDDEKFVNDSVTRFRNYYDTYLADPEHSSSLNYDSDFLEAARTSMKEYVAAAPNKIAAARVNSQLSDYVSSRYAHATGVASETRTNDLIRSIGDRNDSTVRSYVTGRSIPGYDPNVGIIKDLKARYGEIDAVLGKIAPSVAQKSKDKLTIDAAYAAMDHSPDLATKILDVGGIVGQDRRVMDNHIKESEHSLNSLRSVMADKKIRNLEAMIKEGKQRDEIDHSVFNGLLPSDKAFQVVSALNDMRIVYNRFHDESKRLSPKNSSAQIRELAKIEKAVGNNQDTAYVDDAVRDLLKQKVADNVSRFQQDHVLYMREENPVVHDAYRRVTDYVSTHPDIKTNDLEYRQLKMEADALLLKFTSTPDPDLPQDEKDLYWEVNRADQAVMGESEAKGLVDYINGSDPSKIVETFAHLEREHPGETATVMTQLTKSGLDGGFWLLGKNLPDPVTGKGGHVNLATLAQSIKDMKNKGSELNPDEVNQFVEALQNHGLANEFFMAMPSVNGQLTGVAVGVQQALVAYGMHLQRVGGLSPEAAMPIAFKEFVTGVMHVANVNGQFLIFDRKGRNDDQIESEARKLGLLPRTLDTSALDLEGILFRNIPPPGEEMVKQQSIRDHVWATGFFMPSADGKTANLYMRGDNFESFEVRDKKNRAIQVNLEDLPKMLTSIPGKYYPVGGGPFVSGPSGLGFVPPREEFVDPPKDLVVTTKKTEYKKQWTNPWAPHYEPITTSTSVTNWPVEPKFIRHVEVKR